MCIYTYKTTEVLTVDIVLHNECKIVGFTMYHLCERVLHAGHLYFGHKDEDCMQVIALIQDKTPLLGLILKQVLY